MAAGRLPFSEELKAWESVRRVEVDVLGTVIVRVSIRVGEKMLDCYVSCELCLSDHVTNEVAAVFVVLFA